MEIKEEEWYRFKALVEQIDRTVNGNGKPGLWERMVEHVDERVKHKANNAEQADMQLHHLLEGLTKKFEVSEQMQNTRHIANIERFGSIGNKFAYASGVAAVVVIIVNHYWK